jgi:methionyl-tRNA formyltransferase
MRIILMGTPEFARQSLDGLLSSGFNVVAVVTTPDKPAGRGLKVHQSAVKQYAVDKAIPVLQPEKLKAPDFIDSLRAFNADLFVVVAFRMLPEVVWEMPALGTVNLHASVLPQYRGAAPINWAIINGETSTGTTVFYINQEIDKGNIISFREEQIYPEDTAGSLHDRLMHSGAEHLVSAVKEIELRNVHTITQESRMSAVPLRLAPKIFKSMCKIDWNADVYQMYNFVRGLSPYPVAWTNIQTDKGIFSLKIFETKIVPGSDNLLPAGTIVSDNKTYLHVATGSGGFLALQSVQLEGKKRMPIEDFLKGCNVTAFCD